jgi:hypothetical protein
LAYACLAIPLTLLPAHGLLNTSGGTVGSDFLAFYSAAVLTWSHSAQDVFNLSRLFAVQDSISGTATHFPFPYPPFFLLYVAPLAALNYLPALYVWLAATSAPFIFIVRKMSGVAAPVIVLAPPLIQNAISGQNGALTASRPTVADEPTSPASRHSVRLALLQTASFRSHTNMSALRPRIQSACGTCCDRRHSSAEQHLGVWN